MSANRVRRLIGLLGLVFILFSIAVIGAVQGDPDSASGPRALAHVLTVLWGVILAGVGIGLVYSLYAALAYRRMMRPAAEMVKVMQESGLTTGLLVQEFEGLFQQYLREAAEQSLAAGQPPPEHIGESVIERASTEMQHKYGLTVDQMARVIVLFARNSLPGPVGTPDVIPCHGPDL